MGECAYSLRRRAKHSGKITLPVGVTASREKENHQGGAKVFTTSTRALGSGPPEKLPALFLSRKDRHGVSGGGLVTRRIRAAARRELPRAGLSLLLPGTRPRRQGPASRRCQAHRALRACAL